jgi:uncharacterized protein DUF1501
LCQSVLLASGGIKSGRVHGSSDRIGAYPAMDPGDPVDIHATFYHCLGLNPGQVVHDHLRRPYPLCTGRVLTSLVWLIDDFSPGSGGRYNEEEEIRSASAGTN